MTEPAPVPTTGAIEVNPGKTLGIVGLVMSFFFGLNIVGLILSIVGLNKSKKAGMKNTPAFAGIIVSIVTIIIGVIVVIAIVAIAAAGVSVFQEMCEGMASGSYELNDGTPITCP